jgi:hypothetical protein
MDVVSRNTNRKLLAQVTPLLEQGLFDQVFPQSGRQ